MFLTTTLNEDPISNSCMMDVNHYLMGELFKLFIHPDRNKTGLGIQRQTGLYKDWLRLQRHSDTYL